MSRYWFVRSDQFSHNTLGEIEILSRWFTKKVVYIGYTDKDGFHQQLTTAQFMFLMSSTPVDEAEELTKEPNGN